MINDKTKWKKILAPTNIPEKSIALNECDNIASYVERMKTRFWSDWNHPPTSFNPSKWKLIYNICFVKEIMIIYFETCYFKQKKINKK